MMEFVPKHPKKMRFEKTQLAIKELLIEADADVEELSSPVGVHICNTQQEDDHALYLLIVVVSMAAIFFAVTATTVARALLTITMAALAVLFYVLYESTKEAETVDLVVMTKKRILYLKKNQMVNRFQTTDAIDLLDMGGLTHEEKDDRDLITLIYFGTMLRKPCIKELAIYDAMDAMELFEKVAKAVERRAEETGRIVIFQENKSGTGIVFRWGVRIDDPKEAES
jgi:hypothetical protein